MVYVPPQYQSYVQNAANALGIPYDVVAAQIGYESSFDPNAVSSAGAQGIAQFEPGTFAQYGSGSPFNVSDAFNAYVNYMKHLLQVEGGSLYAALEGYNAGEGNLKAGSGYAAHILGVAGVSSSATSSGGDSSYNSAMVTTPTLDMATLESESGIASAVVNSDPELKRLFQNAVSGGWSTARFTSELQNTSWFKNHSDSYRQFLLTRYTDPATYNQNLKQEILHIQTTAASMGAVISQAYATNLASSALAYNWTSEQLQNALAGSVWYRWTGHLGGDAGKQEMTLRGLAANNGVSFDDNFFLDAARQIEAGTQSEQYYEGWIREQAAKQYKAYGDQIKSGMNLSDLASTYMQSMSKVLEVNTPTLSDPTIRKALQWTNPQTNQVEQMPIWQFEDQLRQDPRWLKTDNARDSMYSVAHTVLQNFGFMGA
jgi:hypothetical protein